MLSGIRIIRPTHRAVIERFGKYKRWKESGITWIIPLHIEKLYSVNITEQMTEVEQQEIITSDNLNAKVDAQVYFKVKPDEENVKRSFYSVYNYQEQIIALARTTLRNVIGGKPFVDVNSKRNELNNEIARAIATQVEKWGIEVVRCELKEIRPPEDVQETMNNVIKANNTKTAAIDYATATETKADGDRRATIKVAEGDKQSAILRAEGQAQAIIKVAEADAKQIKLVNEAATEYFKDNAILLKQFETNRDALIHNSKIIFTEKGMSPIIVIGDSKEGSSIIPMPSQMPPVEYRTSMKKSKT